MGFLSDIFKKAKKPKNAKFDMSVTMKGYEPSFTSFGKSVLYSDLILSAMRMKARFFGKLEPRHVRIKDGKNATITDSSVARLMRTPNDFQTMYDFLTQAFFMREVYDNCYIYPDYYISNAGQRIYKGMYVLIPNMTPLVFEDESGKLFIQFQFVNPSREVVFPLEDIVIWRSNMEDNQFIGGGRFASNANADLLNTLEAYHSIKESVAEASKLGCYFDGIVKVNAYSADTDKAQAIRNQFIKDLQANKGGIAVLDNGAEYQEISRQLKFVDAQTMKEIKENVLIHTGVTIEMLEGKMTTQDKEAFYENFIEPSAISLGQALSKCFFSQWQTSYGDQIILYPNKVQLMATSEIVSIIQSTISAGVFKIDEYREMLGYAPLDNEEGQVRPRGFNNLDGSTGILGGANNDEGKEGQGTSTESESAGI